MATLDEEAPAPRFTLPALDGATHSLAEALTKNEVLAVFYKASCPTCQLTLPYIERFHTGLSGNGFVVWAISQDETEPTRRFASEYGLTLPILLDREPWPVSDEYGLSSVPSQFLIGRDGKISWQRVGFDRAGLQELAASIAARTKTARPPATIFPPGDSAPAWKPG